MSRRLIFSQGAQVRAKTELLMLVALALSATFLVWLGQATDVDLHIARLSYDVARKQFPFRDAWVTKQFFHVYIKLVAITLAVVFFVCTLIDYWRPGKYWSRGKGLRIRAVALCAILVPSIISVLKQSSRLHCPWDLAMFGGVESYFRLLDVIPAGSSPGHCFPAGHASGGFWLASIMIFWLPKQARLAWSVGFGLFCVGLLMGIVQQIRGAHFTTHTLWSAWIAIFIIYAVYFMLRLVERRHSISTAGI